MVVRGQEALLSPAFASRVLTADLCMLLRKALLYSGSTYPQLAWRTTARARATTRSYAAMASTRFAYVKNFELPDPLLPDTYLVVRIDGHGFHKFSDAHGFTKPNDEPALQLMDTAARGVMDEFKDIVLAFGESDEFRCEGIDYLSRANPLAVSCCEDRARYTTGDRGRRRSCTRHCAL